MKKIILLLLLLTGLVPSYKNNQVQITCSQYAVAQNNNGSTACPTNVGGSGNCAERQSLWEWLGGIIQAVGRFIQDVVDALGQGGGSNGTENPGPNMALLYSMLTGAAATNPPSGATHYANVNAGGGYHPSWPLVIPEDEPDPNFEDCDGVMGGRAFYDNCNTCVGGTTGLLPCYVPPPDCAGVNGGTAYRDSCNRCVGGTTGLLPCRIDTVKPIKIPCDTNAVKRDTALNGILNSIESKPEMINLRDSASIRKFEVGFTINRTLPNGVPTNTIVDYIKNGTARNVNLSLFTNTIAWVHAHPPFDSLGIHSVDGPSAMDVMGTIFNWSATTQRRFFAQYVISGDTNHHDYALSVADTNLLKQFYAIHPYDSAIDTRDYIIKNGVSVLNLQKNNWRGDRNDGNSFFGRFLDIVKILKNDNYPKQYLEDYANVILMGELNMGVTMHRKVNGQFKEFSFSTEIDNTGKKHYKIKICE